MKITIILLMFSISITSFAMPGSDYEPHIYDDTQPFDLKSNLKSRKAKGEKLNAGEEAQLKVLEAGGSSSQSSIAYKKAMRDKVIAGEDVRSILISIEDILVNSDCIECGLKPENTEALRINKSIYELQEMMKERLGKVAYKKENLTNGELALQIIDQIKMLHLEVDKMKVEQHTQSLKTKKNAAPDCTGVVSSESGASKPLTNIESALVEEKKEPIKKSSVTAPR